MSSYKCPLRSRYSLQRGHFWGLPSDNNVIDLGFLNMLYDLNWCDGKTLRNPYSISNNRGNTSLGSST